MKHDIEYLYIGLRKLNSTTLAQCFLREGSDEEIFFKGIKGVSIGYKYYGNEKSMKSRPESVKYGLDNSPKILISDEQLARYEAEEMSSLQWNKKRLECAKADKMLKEKSKSKKIKDLRKEIKNLTVGMTLSETRRFLDYLSGYES